MSAIEPGYHSVDSINLNNKEYYTKLSTEGYAKLSNVAAPKVKSTLYSCLENCTVDKVKSSGYVVVNSGKYNTIKSGKYVIAAQGSKVNHLTSELNALITKSFVEVLESKQHVLINGSEVQDVKCKVLKADNSTLLNIETELSVNLKNCNVIQKIAGSTINCTDCNTLGEVIGESVGVVNCKTIASIFGKNITMNESQVSNVTVSRGSIDSSIIHNTLTYNPDASSTFTLKDSQINRIVVKAPIDEATIQKVTVIGGFVEEIIFESGRGIVEQKNDAIVLNTVYNFKEVGKPLEVKHVPTQRAEEDPIKSPEEDTMVVVKFAPDEFCDPESFEIMENPYLTPTLQTYDKSTLEKYTNTQGKMECMFTRQVFDVKDCVPNTKLKAEMEKWFKTHIIED